MARGSRLAEDPGNRVELVLRSPAFTREQVHGEPDVAGLCHAPRDVLDVAREAAVLVADEHDGVASRSRGPREVSVEPHAFSGKFGDPGDDRGIVGRDQGRRGRGGLAGRRDLRPSLEHLRRERRAGDARDRLQRLAARQAPFLVVLDGFFHQIALQLVHVHLS